MIRLARAKGISVRLSSNLSMALSDEYIEALVQSGLDTLVVSLDGASAETYQHYRRRGSFERVCENMRRIQAAKKRLKQSTPVIVCQFLVFRHNEHEIAAIRSAYREWGADQLVIEGAQMPAVGNRAGSAFEPSIYPEYNIYHADHPYQREARRQMRSGQVCSWLYGGLVLNPNGKVSPCCASPAETDDFGDYEIGRGLWGVWNNARFRAARRLFAASGRPVTAEIINGMGVQAHSLLKPGELICQQCPIPFRQDEADRTIARVARGLLRHIWRPRSALAFLLMGGMNRFIFRRVAQAITRRQHRRSI
jgi:MoaA/NifB/PqqE/SkfB family radical SAM enzyme